MRRQGSPPRKIREGPRGQGTRFGKRRPRSLLPRGPGLRRGDDPTWFFRDVRHHVGRTGRPGSVEARAGHPPTGRDRAFRPSGCEPRLGPGGPGRNGGPGQGRPWPPWRSRPRQKVSGHLGITLLPRLPPSTPGTPWCEHHKDCLDSEGQYGRLALVEVTGVKN